RKTPSRCSFFFSARSAWSTLLSRTTTCKGQPPFQSLANCLDRSEATKIIAPPTSRAGHRGGVYSPRIPLCPHLASGKLQLSCRFRRRRLPLLPIQQEMAMFQPIVFLPGLICDARLWRDIIDGFADTMAPMVADLRLDETIAAMASRTLAAAPPRFALAGLSMGGYVALEIMRQAPDRVTHLALLDTSARADTDERRETRRKGIEMIGQGKFIGVSRGLLGQLVAPDHLGTPLA